MNESELKNTTLLNSKADESSLKLLVARSGETLGDLLQGDHSLGKYIEDAIVNGVPLEAVPSDTNLHPNGSKYFAAADSPITNGHRANISVLQIEISNNGRTKYQANYSIALGEAFLKFYERYFGKYTSSTILLIIETISEPFPSIQRAHRRKCINLKETHCLTS